jgi:hypothetical protein
LKYFRLVFFFFGRLSMGIQPFRSQDTFVSSFVRHCFSLPSESACMILLSELLSDLCGRDLASPTRAPKWLDGLGKLRVLRASKVR